MLYRYNDIMIHHNYYKLGSHRSYSGYNKIKFSIINQNKKAPDHAYTLCVEKIEGNNFIKSIFVSWFDNYKINIDKIKKNCCPSQ